MRKVFYVVKDHGLVAGIIAATAITVTAITAIVVTANKKKSVEVLSTIETEE